MDIHDYEKILTNWEIDFSASRSKNSLDNPREEIILSDVSGSKWILELFSENTYSRKLELAEILELLENHDCRFIHPFKRNTLGQFITSYAGQLCMLRPHIQGIVLEPNAWMSDESRAEPTADMLLFLNRFSKKAYIKDDGKAFALIDFVKRRTETFERHRPDVAESLSSVFSTLDTHLFPVLTTLPSSFAHGDLKPDDFLWNENSSIYSVMNWEYCGMKPEAYDLAMLIGCLGFDYPDALNSKFTKRLFFRLREASTFAEESWTTLYDLMLASRYNWLTEWMRTNNEKKRDLEILYMNLLVTQRSYIIKKWASADP